MDTKHRAASLQQQSCLCIVYITVPTLQCVSNNRRSSLFYSSRFGVCLSDIASRLCGPSIVHTSLHLASTRLSAI